MKKISKRLISTALSMALAVVLCVTSLPQLSIPGHAAIVKSKTNTGLGTGAITNPTSGAGGWSYVYYGTYDSNSVKYRVLDKAATEFGGNTMLLDCNGTLLTHRFDDDSNVWANSEIKTWLNGNDFLNNDNVFTTAERTAIASSTKANAATGDGDGWAGALDYAPLAGEKIFLLDAKETTRLSYGYANTYNGDGNRSKTGAATWWLRSPHHYYDDYAGCVNPSGYIIYTYVHHDDGGVSPALNINLSSVIFSSIITGTAGNAGAEYKLTVKDAGLTVTLDKVTRDDNDLVTVPYTVTGNASQVSAVVTNGTWTDNGWSANSEILQYTKISGDSIGTQGSFTLDGSITGVWGTNYHVYILAENIADSDYKTDYASVPVEIKAIGATVSGYTGDYDGMPHGISISVTDPAAGSDVEFSENGTDWVSESPTITEINESPRTVYYRISASSYLTETGSATITIKAKNTTNNTVNNTKNTESSDDKTSENGSNNEETPPANSLDDLRAMIRAAIAKGGAQTVYWNWGTSLPYDIMKTLQDNSNITLNFKYKYMGQSYEVTIPGKAVTTNINVQWYGPVNLYNS